MEVWEDSQKYHAGILKLYSYPYPHPGILKGVGYWVYTPVFIIFFGYLPYSKAVYGYGML